MILFDFCEARYSEGDRQLVNGIFSTPENITDMVFICYSVFKGFLEAENTYEYALPKFNDLLKADVMANDKFDKKSKADLLALVFDVVTESNCNPRLWKSAEIASEISHAFKVLYFGQCYNISGRELSEGSIINMGDSYEEVKAILKADMESPLKNIY